MKKKLMLVVCMLAVTVSLFAQIRQFIPIVKPVMHEKTKEFLTEFGNEFIRAGQKDIGNYFKAWAEGGFGSGFLYVDPETGDNYVITNRHVVSYGMTVTLQFEQEDGSILTFENCPVSAISEKLDVALIALPESSRKKFTAGLTILTDLPADGDEIWTAGYPGLLSKPSWQLAKGTISNNRAKVEELADPALFKLYQHTAPIDGGSSGGPLLIKNPKLPSGYGIIGMNTWKILDRQDTNFAIPSQYILDFIKEYKASLSSDKQQSFLKRINNFVLAARGDSFIKLAKYVSYEFVANYGAQLLDVAYQRMNSSQRDFLMRAFILEPVEGMRLAIAYLIYMQLNASKVVKADFETMTFSDDESVIAITQEKTKTPSRWVLEQGQWRLTSFESVEKLKFDKNYNVTAPAISLNVGFGATQTDNYLLAELYFAPNAFFYGLTFGMYTITREIEIREYSPTYRITTQQVELPLIILGESFGIQLPIKLGEISLIPFAGAGMSLIKSTNNQYDITNMGYLYFYGAELFLPSISLGVGLQMRGVGTLMTIATEDIYITVPPMLTLYAKIGL